MKRPGDKKSVIGALLVIVLWTFTWHAWTLDLPFFADDWEFVSDAATGRSDAVLMGRDSTAKAHLRMTPVTVGFYRPTLHGILTVWSRLFGTHPAAFHLLNIMAHTLVVLLFYGILKRAGAGSDTSAVVALPAALVFAVHPAKAGAVSWVAASADIFMTLGAFVSWWLMQEFRRNKKPAIYLMFLAAVLLTLGTKESALLIPVVFVFVDLLVHRDWRKEWVRRAVEYGTLLLLTGAWMSWRESILGPRAYLYTGLVRVTTPDVLLRMAADFPSTLKRLGTGYFGSSGGTSVITSFLTLIALAHSVLILILDGRHSWKRVVPWLVAGIFVLVPTLRFAHEGFELDGSRLYYLATALFVPVFVFGFRDFARAGGRRRLAIFSFLLWIVVSGLGVKEHATRYRAAGQMVQSISDGVRDFANRDGKDTVHVLLDVPFSRDHVPLFFAFEAFAFQPPFTETPHLVRVAERLDWYLERGELAARSDLNARILRFDETTNRILAVSELLPRPDGPDVLQPDPRRPGYYRSERGAAPRGIRSIVLEFAQPPQAGTKLEIAVHPSNVLSPTFTYQPQRDEAVTSIQFRMEDRPDFVLSGRIHEIRIRGQDEQQVPRVVRLEDKFPLIEIVRPHNQEDLSLSAEEPVFWFKDNGAQFYRFEILVPQYVLRTVARHELEKNGNQLGFRFTTPGRGPQDTPVFPWSRSSAILDRLGVAALDLGWRVSAINGAEEWPQAVSGLGTARVVR